MADLLSPITETQPCGGDFSFSAEFDAIQELRREDDPTLDQGEWVTALKTADWPAVVSQCERLLVEHTKDLRLLAWRTEALARTQGYCGLAQGLADTVQVCERYWDDLHPLPDGDDVEQRAGTLRWLLAQVQKLAPRLAVTAAPAGRHSLLDFEEARQWQQQIERQPELAASAPEGKPTLAQVTRARNETPPTVWHEHLAALARARSHLDALQAWVDPRLGDDAPTFVHARQALDDAHHAVQRLAQDAGALVAGASAPGARMTPPPSAPGSADGSAPSHNAPGAFALGGPTASATPSRSPAAASHPASSPMGPVEPQTRAQALQQLRLVADFFRRTEPHSPVAFLADKAARWGDMPLDAWLREVIKDAGSLAHLEELLGLPNAAE